MCPPDTRHGLYKFSLFYKSLSCALPTDKVSFYFSFFSCWSCVSCIINPTVCHINTWWIYVTWSISKNNLWSQQSSLQHAWRVSPSTITLLLVHMTKIIRSLTLYQNQLENATTCSNGQFCSSLTWKYLQIPRHIFLTKFPSLGLGSVSSSSLSVTRRFLVKEPSFVIQSMPSWNCPERSNQTCRSWLK